MLCLQKYVFLQKMTIMRKMLLSCAAALALTGLSACRPDPAADNRDFVNIADVVPDAILEIRYFSTYNFVGARIDGYQQPTALLTRRAADSLKDQPCRTFAPGAGSACCRRRRPRNLSAP